MKLTALILVIALSHVSAMASAQSITLSKQNVQLISVLMDIKAQSGYDIIYIQKDMKRSRPVSIHVVNLSLEETLKKIFIDQPLEYQIDANIIIVREKKKVRQEPQKVLIEVRGTVIDESGNKMPGVSIRVKDTNQGTVTDETGAFLLKGVDENAILVTSFIGYTPQELKAAKSLTIGLVPKPGSLEEVLVVGYGTRKKATLTGAVVQLQGKDLVNAPVANLTNSLAGRLPGLRAVQSSGEPGYDGAAIDIRGFGGALVIIDGVPGDFSQLDPSEIENISVLKDASANIYGFSAANGAIIVTTKKGNVGPAKISYSGYYGIQNITRYPKFLKAGEFTELYDEAVVNDQIVNFRPITPTYGAAEVEKWKTQSDDMHTGTDWEKLAVRKNAGMQQHNLNVSGGTENTRYFISGGYLDQEAIWASGSTKFKRYNFRSNLSSKISKRLTAELNVGGRMEQRTSPITANPAQILDEIRRTYPTAKPYANNNPEYLGLSQIGGNVLAISNSDYTGYYNPVNRSVQTGASLKYDVPYIEGLEAKAFFSYNWENTDTKAYRKRFSLYSYDAANESYIPTIRQSVTSLQEQNAQYAQTIAQYSLNYAHNFGKKHTLGILALYERRAEATKNISAAREFTLDGLEQLNFGNQTNQTTGGSADETARAGYVGRINYDYSGKYLVEFSARYDGSYKLPPDTRWAFFPAVSAGWVISREDWFKSKIVSNLKLRASWGESPDDGTLAGRQFYAGYNYPNGAYVLTPGTITSGMAANVQPNYLLTYSTSRITDLGINASFFNEMLTLEADVFLRQRTGLPATTFGVVVPSTSGLSLPQENLNGDNTRGFELSIGYNKKIGDLSLNISPNITLTRAQNKHIEQAPYTSALANFLSNTIDRYTGNTFGYKYIGQFQSMAEIAKSPIQDNNANKSLLPGDLKYEDINGDGVINGSDVEIIGRGGTPQMFYGLNIGASWKGFDLSILMQGATNYAILMGTETQRPFFNGGSAYEYFTDRWHRTDIYDPNSAWVPGKFPSTRLAGTDNNNARASSFWLTKAYYLRMKSIEVGYNLSNEILKKINVKSVRIFAGAQNLFTITNVDYLDPEVSGSGTSGRYYPQQRVINFGLQAQF